MLVVRPNWLRPSEKTRDFRFAFFPSHVLVIQSGNLVHARQALYYWSNPYSQHPHRGPNCLWRQVQGICCHLSLEPGMHMVHRHTCRPNIHGHEIKFKREKSTETLEGDTVNLLYCPLLCLPVLNTAHSSCFLGRRALHKGEQKLSFQNDDSSFQVSLLSTCWSWRSSSFIVQFAPLVHELFR